MAEPWIKMRTDLSTNPKVVAIADALNLDEDTVVGKMHRLWSWADKHAKDGRALGTPAWLDRMMKCKGLAAVLMREEIDWLRFEADPSPESSPQPGAEVSTRSRASTTARGGTLVFPRWEEHNSQSAKTRALAMRRMKDVRAKENGERTSVAPEANASATESEQRRNASATRGEERRREKRTTAPAAQDQGPPAAGSPPAAEQVQEQEVTRCQGVQVPSPSGQSAEPSTPRNLDTSTPPAPASLSPARTALLSAIMLTGATGFKPRAIVTAARESDVSLLAALVREFREQVARDVGAGKTPPGPGLLLMRLEEFQSVTDPDHPAIAHATELAIRYEADDRAKAARIARTAHSASAPRHLATSAPSVPGITDHPAFRVLASGDEGDARLRVATSAPGCGGKS